MLATNHLIAGTLALATAAAVFLLLAGVVRLSLRRQRVLRRARSIAAGFADDLTPDAPLAGNGLLARFSRLDPQQRTLIAVCWLALMVALGSSRLLGWPQSIVLALLVLLAVALQLRRRSARRRALLDAQLAPAMRMMAAAIESGQSVHQSLERMVDGLPRPIADELGGVVRALELGRSLEDALDDLARRHGDSFELFAMVVTMQYRVGGSLPRLLLGLATSLQERLNFHNEVSALTAQARYSGWVLALLPLLVMGLMLIVSPGYIGDLLYTNRGQTLLAGAGGLLLVGLLTIRRISSVER